jgi:sugar/nucleoside kinase (ribokinase family)
MDVICVGDVMLDVRADAGTLAAGGDVHGRVLVRPGGTSANAAVWAAWAGASAAVVGAVGDDDAGALAVGALGRHGVDTSAVVRRRAPTGVMLVLHERGDRSMVADRGANAMLEPADLPDLGAGAVLVSGYLLMQEPGTATATAALERATSGLLAVDAASWPVLESFGVERFFETTARCDAVFANDREARVLTGLSGAEAARALGERYRVVAVKRGAAGAACSVDGELHEIPPEPIVESDPTGAGDAFDGVLLADLARGREAHGAARRAAHAGALVASSAETWPIGGTT